MLSSYSDWAATVRLLDHGLDQLESDADALGTSRPTQEAWRQLIKRKLLPQLSGQPHLVVATIGGTNIGKSAIFNLLAGETASAVSPTAAGTKHPVCLVPTGQQDEETLQRWFDGFNVRPWRDASDPLQSDDAHLLFWRKGENVPETLLLLDSPDIDSDASVNWERARAIRQSADLLLAVLTQQKYNDAAVKQFFREAAEADKPVILLFNQCDLDLDQEHWPIWLETFVGETGCRPELVVALPWDRKAANEGTLSVYDVGLDGRSPPTPIDLRAHLSTLHFEELKLQALRGAFKVVLDEKHGAPAYLIRLREASRRFAEAGGVLSAEDMAKVDWPMLPTGLLVGEIRDWWDAHRAEWSRKIHGFYRALGNGLMRPVQYAWNRVREPAADPVDRFRADEQRAILTAVERLFDQLERLAEVGNDTLQPRLKRILEGHSRERLLDDVRRDHALLADIDDDYRKFLRTELDAWREGRPGSVRFLHALDQVGAVARPAITVTLAVSGFMFADGLLGQAAVQMASHAATEAAIAGGITGGGEAFVSGASQGIRHAAARLFVRLQRQYAERRAQWLADWLGRNLLGDLLDELNAGAHLPTSDTFCDVEKRLGEINEAFLAER